MAEIRRLRACPCAGAARQQPLDAPRHPARIEPQRLGHVVGRSAVDEHREQREVVALDARRGGAQLRGRDERERGAAAGDGAQRLEQLLRRRLLVDEAVGAGDAQRDLERRIADLGVGDDARAALRR